jgi:cyclopropane-fatty-acyl-phospholipid synthase
MRSDTAAHAREHAPSAGRLDRLARNLLEARLERLHDGRVVLADARGEQAWGRADDGLAARIDVHRPRFYRRAVAGGALGVAAAYLDGDWDCDDLAALFRIFVRNMGNTGRLDRGTARVATAINRAWHRARANTSTGSRRNIRDHYDLGNDLFRLFLDESMTYSAGVFEHPGATLADAQFAKLDRICRKLDLGPGHRVLEIGTGWGSFALHAARHYGCHVTTTTISDAQYELAAERVREAGLADRVTLLRSDYRDLEGTYDRLVSIEMIEAVGHEYLDTFFGCCSARLAPEGRMLLQVITTGDQYYEQYRRSVDFIQRYVFPGSLCPSLGAMIGALGRATDLRITHLEDLTADYAETLRRWRARFLERADDVQALGYPERFVRLWDYYLQYCEAGFAERHIGDLQLVLDKPRNRDPAIRPVLGGLNA